MTEDMRQQLIAMGLSKQQASSVTAEMMLDLFMREDGKALIQEAKRQVDEMRASYNKLRDEYRSIQDKISDISSSVSVIKDMQEQYGDLSDEKARNTLALYAALISINTQTGAPPADAVNNAGYVVYAYLGGQARREVSHYN